jgi:hypothetical protein
VAAFYNQIVIKLKTDADIPYDATVPARIAIFLS